MNEEQLKEEFHNFRTKADKIYSVIIKALKPYIEKDGRTAIMVISQLPVNMVIRLLEITPKEHLESLTSLQEDLDIPGYFSRLGRAMEKSRHLWPIKNVEEFEAEFAKIFEEVQCEDYPEMAVFRRIINENNVK